MTAPRELYLHALDRLTAVVDAVPADRWVALTPCPAWSARQLLGHLIDGQHQVLAMATGEGPRRPLAEPAELDHLAGIDPAGAWQDTCRTTTATLTALTPTASVSTPLGPQTVEQLLGIALIEPVVHAWDLATATGQASPLDPEAVNALLPGVLALGEQLRASGMYQAPTAVPEDAPAHDRLLAALGRRPQG
jgi:uncharacterized protein (TIGR03086 family)